MAVCIETAKRYSLDDYRTPVFIFERLCSIIYPVSSASACASGVSVRTVLPGSLSVSGGLTSCGPFSLHFRKLH